MKGRFLLLAMFFLPGCAMLTGPLSCLTADDCAASRFCHSVYRNYSQAERYSWCEDPWRFSPEYQDCAENASDQIWVQESGGAAWHYSETCDRRWEAWRQSQG